MRSQKCYSANFTKVFFGYFKALKWYRDHVNDFFKSKNDKSRRIVYLVSFVSKQRSLPFFCCRITFFIQNWFCLHFFLSSIGPPVQLFVRRFLLGNWSKRKRVTYLLSLMQPRFRNVFLWSLGISHALTHTQARTHMWNASLSASMWMYVCVSAAKKMLALNQSFIKKSPLAGIVEKK